MEYNPNWAWFGHLNQPVLSGSEMPFKIAGGQTIVFISPCEFGRTQTRCQSSLQTGFATVTSDLPLVGTLIFSEFGSAGRIAQAGVSSATPSTKQEIIAMAPHSNPSDALKGADGVARSASPIGRSLRKRPAESTGLTIAPN